MALTHDDKTWIKEALSEQEERIVARINQEVADLAAINRLALNKLDEHDTEIPILKQARAH